MRAKAAIEQAKKGDKQSIVVTEIPYQVNKARLIEKIADLVNDKTIEGISDLRDESDREGMRIVIELKRGEVPEVILNNLYKHTQLQQSFGVIMLAIVGGRPKVLNAGRARRQLHRLPPRGRDPPDAVRAAQGRGALPHPRGAEDRARQPGRGHQAHPRFEDRARGARGPHHAVLAEPDSGAGHSRHAAAAADRPRAAEDSRRDGRAAEDDRAAARHSRQRAAADADHRRRAEGRAATSTATTAAPRSSTGTAASSASRT